MPRRNRNDDELDIREIDERDVEIPLFQVIDEIIVHSQYITKLLRRVGFDYYYY